MIKLGVNLPQFEWYAAGTDIATAAAGFEEIGFDSVWAFERLLRPLDQSGAHGLFGAPDVPWPDRYRHTTEPLTALATAAAVTSRVRLGTNVLIAPLHLPVQLAKTLASLDAVSGGRLIAGLGTGWSPDEFAAAAPRPIAERGAALDEFLDIAAAAWGPDPARFRNERWDLAPSEFGPKPAGRIPVYLGGAGPRVLERIARRADGWVPVATPAAQMGASLTALREKAASYGRDPLDVGIIAQLTVAGFERVTSAGRRPYTGDFDQLAEDVAALAEVGVDHVFLTAAGSSRSVQELLENAATFHAAVRAAGV
ncbi:TIGR03619 family F420-dependent LLM class oxidoreductase [Kineosporia succinea]|uniref:F420-dependent oxidoreductase n=1 Tax=Kineosporia succinea TaxID=84632 RepID=A0ABT9P979_9ACTN|nr:TIGR03619 family F420-dependent LLM class oxidoreductase [Kineosporia succinea]MDP9829258.1 putative F420-dependent oxidoreductase [Kineosporia succinea]